MIKEFLFTRELKKIVDVVNKKRIRYVIKYGIVKAEVYMLLATFVLSNLQEKVKIKTLDIVKEIGLKMLLVLICGIIWGVCDYIMHEDIIASRRKLRINKYMYIFLDGFISWGILCIAINIKLIPLDMLSITSSIFTLPFLGIVLGYIDRRNIDMDLIYDIYHSNVKGIKAKKVIKKSNIIQIK